MTASDARDTVPLTDAHRLVRALGADEGPHAGTLVTDGDAVRVWCVEPDAFDARFLGAEHVWAPVGFARTSAGTGALLPWCVVRVGAFLTRRAAAQEPLDAGEWVTVLASLLRGLGECAVRADEDLHGDWWLTDDGRPVLVPGPGRPAHEAVDEIFAEAVDAVDDRALRRLCTRLRETIGAGRPPLRRLEQAEAELCAFAAPRPLRMDVHPPELAVHVGVATSIPLRRVRDRRSAGERRGAAVVRALRAVVRGAAERWLSLRSGLRSRLPARVDGRRATEQARPTPTGPRDRAPRRRLVGVAVAVAAAVIAIGIAWPADGPAEGSDVRGGIVPVAEPPDPGEVIGAAEGAGEETAGSAPEEPSDAASPTIGAPDPEDPESAVPGLLDALDACAAEEGEDCAAIAPGSATAPADVLRADAVTGVALVDDYGDIAVVRLGGEEAAQMLVVVRSDEKWLVRDAYDVVDQP